MDLEWNIVIAYISEQNQIYEGADRFYARWCLKSSCFTFYDYVFCQFTQLVMYLLWLSDASLWSADEYLLIVMIQAHTHIRLALV